MAGSFRFRWVAISCRLLAVLAVLADGHHGEGNFKSGGNIQQSNIEHPMPDYRRKKASTRVRTRAGERLRRHASGFT